VKILGLMRARNEAWIIRYSAAAALGWVDELVVLDHASTDHTIEIALAMATETKGRVRVMHDPDPRWNEMAQLNRMLTAAREREATHIALIDADEILTAPFVSAARRLVGQLGHCEALRVPLHNLWRSLRWYRDDKSKHGKQFVVIAFRDDPSLHWPEAEQFNHRSPLGIITTKPIGTMWRLHGVMHLQRANWRRAQARQDLYRMREVLTWPGREPVHVVDARYQSSLEEHGATLKQVPSEWWAHGIDQNLIDLDAEPWEIGECQRLLSEHGRRKFAGLALSCA